MSTVAPPTLQHRSTPPATTRRGALALALQEPLTAGARLRANRQVASDGEAFRTQIKHLIARADQEARAQGYDPADVKLAVYAYVAFLDESVLNSGQPMFANWARQPLQEELFGDHRGGELFFHYLDELLARPDSEDLADLLEVFQLCMLLGFRGRYGAVDDGGLRTRLQAVHQKIERIRGRPGALSPIAALPQDDRLPELRDPWLRRLLLFVGALLLITVVLYVVFRLSLGGQVNDLRDLATELLRQ
ncbi:MAG TPA: DotU family type IV/VI secretion system protein [Longimicrobiaceae bacterium]